MTPRRLGPVLLFVLASIAIAPAQPAVEEGASRDSSEPARRLHLRWVLTEPPSGEPARAEADLILAIEGPALPATSGWALFFNFPLVVDPLPKGSPVQVHHVNGDLWRIQPKAGWKSKRLPNPLKISLRFEGSAVNRSMAPNGFYLREQVRDTFRTTPVTLELPSHVDTRSMQRAAEDVVPPETAETRYRFNQEAARALVKMPKSGAASHLVLPTPRRQRVGKGSVVLESGSRIGFHPDFAAEARFLKEALRSHFAIEARLVEAGRPDGATVWLNRGELSDLAGEQGVRAEGYRLTVRPKDGVRIDAETAAGAFYGIQSLLALAEPLAYRTKGRSLDLPEVDILDVPRFAYRGMHLDVARNFHGVASVKKVLDLMAFYKLNRLHFHLTDDEGWRLEIPGLPELTSFGAFRGAGDGELPPSFGSGPERIGGFYSAADMIEMLRYATRRHIEVIPEIDLPGHARAAIAAMKHRNRRAEGADQKRAPGLLADPHARLSLHDPADTSRYRSVQGWRDNVLCVCREDTFLFIDKIVETLVGMYREADAPLRTIHAGGDEVPKGAWLDSPDCQAFLKAHGIQDKNPQDRLFSIFFERLHRRLAERGIRLAGWEESALITREGGHEGGHADKPNPLLLDPPIQAYVWNDVPGWGREDTAYRLANAGAEVVLCSAPHLYFDLAYQKDFQEPGYYWAGYVDTYKVFRFAPENLFASATHDRMGQPIDPARYTHAARLTAEGAKRVLGIQGQLWTETVADTEALEYMLFPKLLGLAERAWAARPSWEMAKPSASREGQVARDWGAFADRLGRRELPRLDHLFGGVAYRIPLPGARIERGVLKANVRYPGLDLRYTEDGSEPTPSSQAYKGPVSVTGEVIRLRSFSGNGRASRTTVVRGARESGGAPGKGD
ncbi:Beta-N-acetylhexosaminidase [Sulfidibacter corallicola]|uniref:beta-N-acetylhexosaminidase n=1 Tax=Sulfidibacter corallicola TaxID=2818388 RepID=A0A8A4TU63_SULCO|nr:family 20 glycosylhydrolase [Sulfidibacter corallicola]QTD53499.1 family 20 glycosylhydrolase [Sulfidibacter corallicola]